MKPILILLSFTGLMLTILPAVLVFQGIIEKDLHKNLMLTGTALWFVTAPFWIGKKGKQNA
jgi:high-affinity Fe2+/Pb2+ permease